jgi:hypothetical protein
VGLRGSFYSSRGRMLLLPWHWNKTANMRKRGLTKMHVRSHLHTYIVLWLLFFHYSLSTIFLSIERIETRTSACTAHGKEKRRMMKHIFKNSVKSCGGGGNLVQDTNFVKTVTKLRVPYSGIRVEYPSGCLFIRKNSAPRGCSSFVISLTKC